MVDLLAHDNISGLYLYNSNILNDEKLDQTFAKLFVKSGSKFGVMRGGVPMKEPTRYIRFSQYPDYEDYDNVYNFRPDAIIFVPKQKINFMGFGQFTNFHKKDMNLKF